MLPEILTVILLPFLGTTIGAGFVFFLKGQMNRTLQRSLTGFAAGVMVAASIWSLIIPAMDQSEHLGKLAFLPAFIGVWAGFLFLLLLDHVIPHLHMHDDTPEGAPANLGKSTMLVLAVALHNLPEGMAVGVVVAGWLTGNESISAAGALALSIGLQENFSSTMFATALTLAVIVIYDAANVRYYSGQNIKITQQLVKDVQETLNTEFDDPIYSVKIKDVLGHKWVEVIGGICLGCCISLFYHYTF